MAQALAHGRGAGLDRLDAQLLLARVLDRGRAWLLAHDDASLTAEQASRWMSDVARRASGEPLAYIVGEKEFYGLALTVDPRVLVPRPETEVLVDWAIDHIRRAASGTERGAESGSAAGAAGSACAVAAADAAGGAGAAGPSGAAGAAEAPWSPATAPARRVRVLDLGTGSGAIALALKHACPAALLVATDASRDALDVAALNAERLGLAVALAQGAWWQAVEGDVRFDIAVSNPPYIAAADDHLPALRHEPLAALTPGGDGLASLRAVVAGAPDHLRPGGWLLLEHGHDQADAVQALLRAHGFDEVETRPDLGGRPRCTGGQLAGPIPRSAGK